ncbi:NADH dehydrogenase [ubiquinone] 1 alpha subcomplex subunit 3-like [Trachypithecus francoisi]|uniref:NADH dehydrogenase [ubiquinone] 1 alpha subcomplex subunit 3-like n=1 Tax=Trachypithecus francoisi TaxID=54180 RepID=UPI00141B187E|nr:NADH dehydrogenase [ubiquinone] 1 alpha subcomplex subunit 3-like [Trachypithecus francoisi]
MATRLSIFLKISWAREPVLVGSFIIWSLAVILPPLSPYTKYSTMINEAMPYVPDVPSHPQDPQGPSLEWLKKL